MPADAFGVFWDVFFSVDCRSGHDDDGHRSDDDFDEPARDLNIAGVDVIVATIGRSHSAASGVSRAFVRVLGRGACVVA